MEAFRVENKRYEKVIVTLRWLAMAAFILGTLRIISEPEILNGGAKLGDLLIALMPIGFFFQYRKTVKKWGGQFIEWTDTQIFFKSRKYDKTIVEISDIESIIIKLDWIIIKTVDSEYRINIEDYTVYEDRIRLKQNFESVIEKLNK